jgi:two-component system NtrC family sensor kinase
MMSDDLEGRRMEKGMQYFGVVTTILAVVTVLLAVTGGASPLFSFAGFMPHGHCYRWNPTILWGQVVSNVLIGLAYFLIPIWVYLVFGRLNFPLVRGVAWLFFAFILACGIGHFFDVWTIWQPNYRMHTIQRGLTAVASVATATMLWSTRRLAPSVLAGVGRALEEYTKNGGAHSETAETRKLLVQLGQTLAHLDNAVEELEDDIRA